MLIKVPQVMHTLTNMIFVLNELQLNGLNPQDVDLLVDH